MLNNSTSETWLATEFSHCKINDKRLTRNLLNLTTKLFNAPHLPISHLSSSKAEQDRYYRLIGNERVDFDSIFKSHKKETLRRCSLSSCKEIVIVEDTTILETPYLEDYESGITHGKGNKRGIVYHAALMLDGDNFDFLGVSDSLLWKRNRAVSSESKETYHRKKRLRESIKWILPQIEIAKDLSNENIANKKIILVADRESDIYENYVDMEILGHSYVVRICHDRKTPENSTIYSEIENEKVLFYEQVEIKGNGTRPEDIAQMSVRAKSINIAPPRFTAIKSDIKLNIVMVREEHVTVKEPLRWILATKEPIETNEQIKRIIQLYRKRWIVEEFFKGLKTGCKIEERRLESRKTFENFLAISIVITWKILRLKMAGEKEEPIGSMLSSTEIMVINKLTNSKITKKTKTKEVIKRIASLGGYNIYLKRPPGWQTLWHGYQRLLTTLQTLIEFDLVEEFEM